MDFQEKVEELMQKNGIRYVTDLAKAVTGERPLSHKTKTNFNRYIKHGIRMPDDLREPLANALNTTVDYLFTSEERVQRVGFRPMIGEASAAVPIGPYEGDIPYLPVPAQFSGDGYYIVEAEDDSMFPILAGGMHVICSRDAKVENGDLVHYTFEGRSRIRKCHFNKISDLITLMPLNLNGYEPIVVHGDRCRDIRMAKCVYFMGVL